MQSALQIHPDFLCPAVRSIDVELRRSENRLVLHYTIRGAMTALRIPTSTRTRRADFLWQHTCCEAFIGVDDAAAYYEFNFSPSTEWAVYRFDAYRTGMRVADNIEPNVHVQGLNDRLELNAEIVIEEMQPSIWRVGVAAIIEDSDGRKSYWALAHSPGKPDFHRADCFALHLPPNS